LVFPQNLQTFSEIEKTELDQFPQFNLENFKNGIKHLLNGNFSLAFKTAFADFLTNSFQEDIENAASDQIPLRLYLTTCARWVEQAQIKAAYEFLPDPAIPVSADVDYFLLRSDQQVFVQPPATWDDNRRELIDKRIQNYQNVQQLFPEINFFIFYLEHIAYSPYHPMNSLYPQADQGQSFNYFLENKPENLRVSCLLLSSLDEFREKFFNTDHHWNIRGAWAAYEIIYEMLSSEISGLGPKLELKGFKSIEGLNFCGSIIRRTLYPCEPEIFEYADVDIPSHRTFVDGKESEYGNKQAYLNGDFSRDPLADHHAGFYGPVSPLVEYDFDNPNNRNLLIIGGSYTQSMQELVASLYDKTYVVDLRYYEDFSLGELIKQYDIQDVLVIGDLSVLFHRAWKINP
jgi:hypothetical protein